MTNPSILAAFERMWQHITNVLSGKANVGHTHEISEISELQEELDYKIETAATIVRWQ